MEKCRHADSPEPPGLDTGPRASIASARFGYVFLGRNLSWPVFAWEPCEKSSVDKSAVFGLSPTAEGLHRTTWRTVFREAPGTLWLALARQETAVICLLRPRKRTSPCPVLCYITQAEVGGEVGEG